MATITSILTISGRINGRTISFSHTYTIEDAGDAVIDQLAVHDQGSKPGTVSINASYDRAHHNYVTPKMAIVVNNSVSAVGHVQFAGSGTGEWATVLHQGVPAVLHYGDSIGQSIGYDTSALVVPDETVDSILLSCNWRPFDANILAVFKPAS